MRRTAASLLALALVAVPSLTACGSDAPAESAADLLAHAKRTLDGTDTLHFVLDSEGAPKTGTELVGGQGDIARPASFEGTLQVLAMGATVDLSRGFGGRAELPPARGRLAPL